MMLIPLFSTQADLQEQELINDTQRGKQTVEVTQVGNGKRKPKFKS
jgi:hypothetical protein